MHVIHQSYLPEEREIEDPWLRDGKWGRGEREREIMSERERDLERERERGKWEKR